MKRLGLILTLLMVGLCWSIGFAEEKINITTYYPSPYGSYNELQFYPHGTPITTCSEDTKGTTFYNSTDYQLNICNGTAWVAIGGAGAGGESYWVLNETNGFLYANDTNWNVGIGTDNPGTAKLAVINGSIGIGTNQPQQLLDIDGFVNNAFMGMRIGNGAGGGNTAAGIQFHHSGCGERSRIYQELLASVCPPGGDLVIATVYDPSDTNPPNIRMQLGVPQPFGIHNRNALFINAITSDVGINTGTPLARLHVSGTTEQATKNSRSAAIMIQNTGARGSQWVLRAGAASADYDDTPEGGFSIADDTGVNPPAAPKYRFAIDNQGNVGIGTVNPQAKLDVADGGIKVDDIPGGVLSKSCPANLEGTIMYYKETPPRMFLGCVCPIGPGSCTWKQLD